MGTFRQQCRRLGGVTMTDASSPITQWIAEAEAGDQGARELLLDAIHGELKRIADGYMSGEREGHTLQSTALVNEAYLELFSGSEHSFTDRLHFFAYAARVMRHVLVHHARRRNAQKRGGGRFKVTLSGIADEQKDDQVLALDEAMTALAETDAELARIVELRFFAGLSIEELATVTGRAHSTLYKDLKVARGWLFDRLGGTE